MRAPTGVGNNLCVVPRGFSRANTVRPYGVTYLQTERRKKVHDCLCVVHFFIQDKISALEKRTAAMDGTPFYISVGIYTNRADTTFLSAFDAGLHFRIAQGGYKDTKKVLFGLT